MSENKKSILAETLEDIQLAKQQVEENASFILNSTLKEELNAIIKEGLSDTEEEDSNDIAGDAEGDTADSPEADTPDTDEVTPDAETDEIPAEDGADVPGAEGEDEDDEEVIDLTGKSEDEVLATFQNMDAADAIEIVKTEDGIAINFKDDSEDKIEDAIANPIPTPDATAGIDAIGTPEAGLEGGIDATAAPEAGVAPEVGAEAVPGTEEEEPVFEIEIKDDETEEVVDEAMSHNINMKKRNITHNGNDPLRVDETEEATDEAPVTEEEKVEEIQENKLVAARKKISALTLENARMKSELAKINESVNQFQTSENEYKEAISALKTQLQEVALFTSNMTFAVKLMTENATTKEEKVNILKRLDSAKSITESREVYKTLNESFSSKTPATTILEEKLIADEKTSGSSATSQINESKVYENPQVDRIKDIIKKMKY